MLVVPFTLFAIDRDLDGDIGGVRQYEASEIGSKLEEIKKFDETFLATSVGLFSQPFAMWVAHDPVIIVCVKDFLDGEPGSILIEDAQSVGWPPDVSTMDIWSWVSYFLDVPERMLLGRPELSVYAAVRIEADELPRLAAMHDAMGAFTGEYLDATGARLSRLRSERKKLESAGAALPGRRAGRLLS